MPAAAAKRLRPLLWLGIAALSVFSLTVAYLIFSPQSAGVPIVITTGLDPAVAKLINSTIEEVRGAPLSGAAWGKLGAVLMHYEFVEESVHAFDRATKLSPTDPRWPYLKGLLLANRDPDAAIVALQRATELCPDQPDAPRLQLAQLLAERGRTEESERQFEALLRTTRGHPVALLGVARIRRTQGRLVESTSLLSGCLKDPHTAKNAFTLLAAIQQAMTNGPAPEAAARRGMTLPADTPWLDPFWNEAAVWRVGRKARLEDATVLLDQERIEEALRSLSKLAQDYPEDGESWYLLGWTLNRQQCWVEAERALREHLRLSPQSPKGQSQLAIALLNQQRYAEALEVLESALRLKSTWRELHFNSGYACVQLARYDEAIRHFRDAVNCDPNYVLSYTALAELLSRRGENDEARQLLQQALELDPTDSRAAALLQTIKRP
jgi:tetratricopeptide (TPR) repeat protein